MDITFPHTFRLKYDNNFLHALLAYLKDNNWQCFRYPDFDVPVEWPKIEDIDENTVWQFVAKPVEKWHWRWLTFYPHFAMTTWRHSEMEDNMKRLAHFHKLNNFEFYQKLLTYYPPTVS